MEKLYSIQTSNKVFETQGSRPVLITCNDLNDYVCKYNMGNGPAIRLAFEYIAASFLKIWGLKVPDFALVDIRREHIPSDFKIKGYYFDNTCFGSKYSRGYADLHNLTDSIAPQKRKSYINRKDLYYIALFDIWLANEDRNHNNYNLLIDINNQLNFIPIDHETIFNSRVMNNPIYALTYDESLVSTPLMQKMFGLNDVKKLDIEEIQSNFYSFVNQCQGNLVNILSQLPADWKINKNELQTKMINEIFNETWLNNSFKLLLFFLQINSNS